MPPVERHRPSLRTLAGFIALGAGTGLAPWAPGTVASAAAVLCYLACAALWRPGVYWVLPVLCVAGFWACHRCVARWQVQDPGEIVIDEWAGQWLALCVVQALYAWYPASPATAAWLLGLLGFAWFRCFDIAKPWPVSWLDRNVAGGAGIMLDDLCAGALAGLLGWASLLIVG